MTRPMKRSVHTLAALATLALAACDPQAGPSGGAPASTGEAAPSPSAEARRPATTSKPTLGPTAGPDKAGLAAAPPAAPPPAAIPAPPDVAAPPADAKKSASGLAWKVLEPGKGKEHPGLEDKVTVHYTGWTTDGKMFDSTSAHTPPEPTSFPVGGVIKGWTEGLQLMSKGEKRRFWIPANLAYGEKATRPGAPTGMLVFDVELLDFKSPPAPPPVPADVKAPPKTATKTASGLAYRVLAKGKGTEHPKATSRVTVHYTGWTLDGKMFDSSVVRDEPATFALNQVIKGWTEGVQQMVQGEKVRFWIPAELAYGDKPARPGVPAGMLVFDIELLAIQ